MLTLLLAALALAPDHPPVADTSYSGLAHQLDVRIPRSDQPVTIDGRLDEPVWRSAAVLRGFSQYAPTDGLAAADSTEVLVWYSATAIHFGIRAFQPAGTVRATLADRDHISQDDNVTLFLSTFNDGRQAAVFGVNPLGQQADGMLVERGSQSDASFTSALQSREAVDLSPDFVYQSKGRVTDYGYEVEIRIPFKSLRYQSADVQTWGINVTRVAQYRGYEYSWAPALRAAASFLGQSGHLVGLTELRRGLVVDITPEVTQHTDGAPPAAGAWSYVGKQPTVGANVRWGVTNNLTLNGTVNPDFSQVEADAGQISFDPRAALYFAEKRPFFLDGLEQFTVPNNLIYTRRIVQPVGAAKLTGKVGNTEIALLSAVDAASASASGRNDPVFNIVRLQRDVGAQSRLGMMYTDRVDGDDYNRVLEVDSRVVWDQIYSLQLQAAGSATRQAGVSTTAPMWDIRFRRQGHNFGLNALYNGLDDQFVTKSGFLSRVGEVHANIQPTYTWFGEAGAFVEQATGDILLDDIWAYHNFFHSGDARDKKNHYDLHAQLRGGWQVGASLLLETFGFDPAYYNGLYRIERPHPGAASDTLPFTGTARLPNRDWVLSAATPQFKNLTLSVLYLWGQDENFYEWASSLITYANIAADIRASEQLRIGFTYQLQDFVRPDDHTRTARVRDPRLKLEYQVTPSVFVRLIGEYVSTYTDSLRDDTRTNLPLLVYDQPSARWVRPARTTVNAFRGDFLFSYKPVPGTVLYLGYGASMAEPTPFDFRQLQRSSDAFFVKASYLFRL
ncbi:MAG: carbohydrate binding family 9 domain-containing protein [Gemmatimonadetes bacterium]|nr:carbohydrate binding family 9 domain-containing protein [Gemmatimonadota bacterium]MBI3566991.1 carbohydrate binding family 9 domain-containing protein [Gemmatimonadota bacterium]